MAEQASQSAAESKPKQEASQRCKAARKATAEEETLSAGAPSFTAAVQDKEQDVAEQEQLPPKPKRKQLSQKRRKALGKAGVTSLVQVLSRSTPATHCVRHAHVGLGLLCIGPDIFLNGHPDGALLFTLEHALEHTRK